MARANWIDDDNHPSLDGHIAQLEHFADAIADGAVDASELATQENNLKTAMLAVEAELSDAQHEKVTRVLAELAAYTVMQMMHDLAQAKVQRAIK